MFAVGAFYYYNYGNFSVYSIIVRLRYIDYSVLARKETRLIFFVELILILMEYRINNLLANQSQRSSSSNLETWHFIPQH